MKKYVLFACVLTFGLALFGQSQRADFEPKKLFFKIEDEVEIVKQVLLNNRKFEIDETNRCIVELNFMHSFLASIDIQEMRCFSRKTKSPKLSRTYEMTLRHQKDLEEVLEAFNDVNGVEYAEKVPIYSKNYVPNDPNYGPGNQWYLYQINADQAWNYSQGNSNIVIAVVDDAVDIDHPDLSPVLWVNNGEIPNNNQDDDNNGYVDDINGADVANGTGNPRPGSPVSDFDHGTHVAGCAAAATDNNVGVASIGFGVSIMSLRCADNAGQLTSTLDGVLYAIENGANVINMSYGSPYYSNTAQNLFNWANQNQIVLIAAAGNDGSSSPQYPAAYNHVISVAATQGTDQKASFSNYDNGNGWVDLSSPGTSIYNCLPTGAGSYGYRQGTSMAAPIVSGLAGLMLSMNAGLTPSDVETCLKNNCDPVQGSYSSSMGAGRINASATLACVSTSLAWSPQTDFTSNVTTIVSGGAVNFTDQTIYNPTSWSWTFNGGTPSSSSQQNPTNVVYNTPGTYSVSLTTSNSNGSDTETKTAYITVNASTGCDTVTNTMAGDTIYTRIWDYGNNFIGGTNNKGITAYCEYYQDIYPAGTYIQDIIMYFTRGETSVPGNTVDIKIWNDNNGQPGAVVYTESLSMQEIEDNMTVPGNPNAFYPTSLELSSPFLISGDFYVGIEVSGADPVGEEAAIAYTHDFNNDNSGRPNFSWFYASGSNPFGLAQGWKDMSTVFSGSPKYGMHIYLQTTASPVSAVISASSQNICEGDQVQFNASSSTNATTYEWYTQGANPNYSTNLSVNADYNNSGTHTTYLLAYNSCGFSNLDSLVITVSSSPNVSVGASDPYLCPGETTTLTASGASSYSWSPSTSLSSSTGSFVTATPSSSTTYSVLGTSGQCSNVASVSITVEDQPLADFTYTPDSALCYNQPIYFDGALLSVNATSYSWDFDGAVPAISSSAAESVQFPAAGTYTVSLNIENGCNQSDQVSYEVVVDDCNYALIDDLDKLGLAITVNSNTKILNIKGEGKMIGTVALYNMVGQKAKEFTLKNVDVFESALTSLSPSVYLIVVQLEKAAISKKVWLGY